MQGMAMPDRFSTLKCYLGIWLQIHKDEFKESVQFCWDHINSHRQRGWIKRILSLEPYALSSESGTMQKSIVQKKKFRKRNSEIHINERKIFKIMQ